MAIPQDAVRKAWADKRVEIERSFTIVATDRPASGAPQLPDYESTIPDIGLCSGGNSASTFRKPKGDTHLRVHHLFVWNLREPTQKDAEFSEDGATVVLPIEFSLLEVRGRFEATTTCGYYTMFGTETMSQSSSVEGDLWESFGSSTLNFSLTIASSRLAYNDVFVPGVPSMRAEPDSGVPDWLQKFASVMSGHDMNESIRRSIVNVFASADFTRRMIDTMNAAIR